MKTYKICKKTDRIIPFKELTYDNMYASGTSLCIVFTNGRGNGIFRGDKLHFEKYASGNTGQMIKVCEEDAVVRDIVDTVEGENENDKTLKRYVYADYITINPLTISTYLEIDPIGGYLYKFFFMTEHSMVPGDFELYDKYTLHVNNYTLYVKRGDNILAFTDLALCYPNEVVKGEDKTNGSEDSCFPVETTLFNYETMDRTAILAGDSDIILGNDFIPTEGDLVYLSTNPYYFTDTGETDDVTCFNNVTLYRYEDFYALSLPIEDNYDAKRMYQEYQTNELFVNKIMENLVPGAIDLEKLKYCPAYYDENTSGTSLATGLTFNLHFRTRASGATKYSFEDVWHTDEVINTWNGASWETPVEFNDLYTNSEFVNSSNLIGFLGFTDDDVFNQKNRLKQSFLRLSFYDGTNPLEQSLLFYSTVFIDSGDLYGKFVKRKAWLEASDSTYSEIELPVVWSSGSTDDKYETITSQLIVNDEYDTTRSGEGFNLYLFKQDAPTENLPEDIYMKVEFNHAGYGRTVPLIFWRKNGEKPKELETKDYINNDLYIRLKLRLTEKGYVYTFNDITPVVNDGDRKNGILWENDRIVLNLFEPMLKLEEEVIGENEND